MKTNTYLVEIHSHTIKIYENEIQEVGENNNIANWLAGLSSGALLFSFNKIGSVDAANKKYIILQAIIFLSIFGFSFLHRIFTKRFKGYINSIIRMFDFFLLEVKHNPNEMNESFESDHTFEKFDNYLNGNYFNETDAKLFDDLGKKQILSYKITVFIFVLIIVFLLIEFGFFFFVI